MDLKGKGKPYEQLSAIQERPYTKETVNLFCIRVAMHNAYDVTQFLISFRTKNKWSIPERYT
jgi:hypothetical protein